jgi:hypothetical protein
VVVRIEAAMVLAYMKGLLAGGRGHIFPSRPFVPGTNAIGVVERIGEGVLGPAMLGRGGSKAFFSNPARMALAIVTLVTSGAALFAGGNVSTGERKDRGLVAIRSGHALVTTGIRASFDIQVVSACLSMRSDGGWRFGRLLVCCSLS